MNHGGLCSSASAAPWFFNSEGWYRSYVGDGGTSQEFLSAFRAYCSVAASCGVVVGSPGFESFECCDAGLVGGSVVGRGVVETGEKDIGNDAGGGSESVARGVPGDVREVPARESCVRSKGQRKRDQKKRQRDRCVVVEPAESVVQGKCETVVSAVSVGGLGSGDLGSVQDSGRVPIWRRKAKSVGVVSSQSSCPSYGQAMSEAEKEAKDSLARRRAAENAVAERLAKMKLESLEDEKKCQEYADLKKQRLIQWRNEALAKSQASLDKCKSVDPGSSASQYEIRMQAKLCADQKFQLEQVRKKYAELHGARAALKFLDATRAPGVDTEIEMEQDALLCEEFGKDDFWSGN